MFSISESVESGEIHFFLFNGLTVIIRYVIIKS